VTNLEGRSKDLCKKIYCARGNMKNGIKMVQSQLFADRVSCHNWYPKKFRLLLASLVYVLIDSMRRTALQKTKLAEAKINTLCLKLLKIGGAIVRNTRRMKVMLSSSYPHKGLYTKIAFICTYIELSQLNIFFSFFWG